MSKAAWPKNLIRPLIALLFIYLLIVKGPFQLQQITFILAQKKILLLGVFLVFLQFCLSAFRWKKIVEQKTALNIKLSFQLTLIGQFFSFFIPGGVSGDVVKALELSKTSGLSRSESFSTVLSDRILGLFSMVLFSTVFLALDYFNSRSETILSYFFFSALLLAAMICGIALGPKIVQILSSFFNSKQNKILQAAEKIISSFSLTFSSFRQKKILLVTVAISFATQMVATYFMTEIVRALDVSMPSFFVFFALSCFGFLASAIPITPAGIGVGQAAFYFLFSTVSIDLGNAAVTAVSILQLFFFFYALIGGVLFATKPFLTKTANQSIAK